ncbi:TraR/DksA C4-type zinc finger protein [Candidatus Shapirobacteria bacterium]|nr:TraR/DksA C4-type zinc finger protein [Candidatus Shapirobacteria bacterium]
MKDKKGVFTFPARVLKPVNEFLKKELKKLLTRRQQVVKADPFSDPTRTSDNAAEDAEAAEQFGHAQAEAIKNHLDRRIVQVRKALSRIKIGRYGVCEECDRFIDTERLMVFPETTICVDCGKKKKLKKSS